MNGLWAKPTSPPPPGVNDPTGELPVFGPTWSPPDTRNVDLPTAVACTYLVEASLLGAIWRAQAAAYALHQATTRWRRRRAFTRIGLFVVAVAAGMASVWLTTAATVVYSLGGFPR